MDSAQNRGAHLFGKSAKKYFPEKVSSLETQEMSFLRAHEMSSLGTHEISFLETQDMSCLEAQHMSCLDIQDMGHPSDTHLWVTPVTQNR